MSSTDDIPDEIPLGTLAIGEKIGEGGFGQVFKATQHPFDQTLAVKFLNPSPFQHPDSRAHERFEKEANILLSLRHEYITPIYGVGEYEGKPYILMEYFEGMNLQKARDKHPPATPQAVLNFFEYVTSALDYAHRKNVFHRDIKPSNLMARKGSARVVDFGIAHVLDPDGQRLTKQGATPVGGDAYAAPELIADPRLEDPRCDIFSLGACWFWLLTGQTPKGRRWESKLRMLNGMTPEYESVLLKTLDEVDSRYQSMAELLTDIKLLRTDDSPQSMDGELDDDAICVLGVLFEQYISHTEGTRLYYLEQRLSKIMNTFTLSLGIRTLKKCGFIELRTEFGDFNEPFQLASITEAGEEWVIKNRGRVQLLLPEARTAAADDFDDDIPF